MTDELVEQVKAKMQEYIDKDLCIIKKSMPLDEKFNGTILIHFLKQFSDFAVPYRKRNLMWIIFI